MKRCTHNDCFTCPYKDCISEYGPKVTTRKREKLSDSERKIRKAQINKKYYDANRARLTQMQRDYYAKKRAAKHEP